MNIKIKKIFTILSMSFVFATVGCKSSQEKTVNIKFLATSDMHGMMLPYDYALDSEVDTGSVTQMATLIDQYRNDNTIVIDVGDMVQGNYAEMFKVFNQHPMFEALNLIGYDVFVTGNHEFNHGVEFLQKQMNTFNGAALCGNVINKDEHYSLGNPYTIIEKEGVRVAVIGMVSPCITQWDGEKLTKWSVIDPIVATNACIKDIKDNNKADIIVAAEHMGLNQEYGVSGSSVTEIANNCPGLDLIIGAHEHTSVNQEINGVLVMENKSNCQTLVEVNLEVKGTTGNFKINKKDGKIHNLKEEQPKTNKYLDTYFEPFDAFCKLDAHMVVGKLANGPLAPEYEIKKVPSTFMQPTALVSLVNNAQIYKGNQYLETMKDPNKVKVSATSIGNYWANINKKDADIRKCDVSLVYKFVNTLYILEMNKAQLKQFMEYSAQFLNKCEADHLTISFNSKIPLYNYDMFSGVKYEIDVSQDPGNRIKNLKWENDTEISDNETFYIAVNNYRANTQLLKPGVIYEKGSLPALKYSDANQGQGIREGIADYIQSLPDQTYDADPEKVVQNWKYVGMKWSEDNRAKAIAQINRKDNPFYIGEQNTIPMKIGDLD